MALLVGALLAIGVGLLGTSTGLDRDRAFYPLATMVVASYYALFAVMGGSTHAVVLESLVALAFLAAAVVGFRSSLSGWWWPRWWATESSTSSTRVSYPILGCRPGGHHSVSPMM